MTEEQPPNDARVSRNQIMLVSGLITTVAAGVAFFLMELNSSSLETIDRLHAAEISRIETQVESLEQRERDVMQRAETYHSVRVQELKDMFNGVQESLMVCLQGADE